MLLTCGSCKRRVQSDRHSIHFLDVCQRVALARFEVAADLFVEHDLYIGATYISWFGDFWMRCTFQGTVHLVQKDLLKRGAQSKGNQGKKVKKG